jgi:hypothetical protein
MKSASSRKIHITKNYLKKKSMRLNKKRLSRTRKSTTRKSMKRKSLNNEKNRKSMRGGRSNNNNNNNSKNNSNNNTKQKLSVENYKDFCFRTIQTIKDRSLPFLERHCKGLKEKPDEDIDVTKKYPFRFPSNLQPEPL